MTMTQKSSQGESIMICNCLCGKIINVLMAVLISGTGKISLMDFFHVSIGPGALLCLQNDGFWGDPQTQAEKGWLVCWHG